MSHISVDNVVSSKAYSNPIIDHEATERAESLDQKCKLHSSLQQLLHSHGAADFVELHLLHKHFEIWDGEAIVQKPLSAPESDDVAAVNIDIAKVRICKEPASSALTLLLWMTSLTGDGLVADEYGLSVSQVFDR